VISGLVVDLPSQSFNELSIRNHDDIDRDDDNDDGGGGDDDLNNVIVSAFWLCLMTVRASPLNCIASRTPQEAFDNILCKFCRKSSPSLSKTNLAILDNRICTQFSSRVLQKVSVLR
jgi:hypothetical protein